MTDGGVLQRFPGRYHLAALNDETRQELEQAAFLSWGDGQSYRPLQGEDNMIERRWESRKAWAFTDQGVEIAWLYWRPGQYVLTGYFQTRTVPGPQAPPRGEISPKVREWANQSLMEMDMLWRQQQTAAPVAYWPPR